MPIPVTVIDGARFPKSKDGAAEIKLKQRLHGYNKKAEEHRLQYRYWLNKGVIGKAREAAHYALHSFSFKFVCAIEQNKRLPFARRISLVELAEAADALQTDDLCEELVRLHAEPKRKPGEFRPVCDFGPMHRTAQTAARLLLNQYVILHLRPWQYDFKGTAAAILAIRQAILAGNNYFVHLDIKNFYGSFDHMALREALPVPRKMADHHLVGRKLKFACWGGSPSSYGVLQSEARKGVMHGSSASHIIGAGTISSMEWQPSKDGVAAWYVDDVMIVGSSELGVMTDAEVVIAAIAALPTGTFKAVVKSAGHIADGADFLGVNIKLGQAFQITPLPECIDDFHEQLTKLCKSAKAAVDIACQSHKQTHAGSALEKIAETWSYGQGWYASFAICNGSMKFFETAYKEVMKLLATMGKSGLDDLKHYLPKAKKGGRYAF